MVEMTAVNGDAGLLKQAFGCFPSGVAAVCALVDGKPAGMAASSFTSVSIQPPLVAVCVQHTSTTWPKIRRQARLGLSILAESHDETCIRLSSKNVHRFDGISWETGAQGAVFLDGASAWLECSVFTEHPGGDHSIALLEVHRLRAEPDTSPLVFHASRFARLIAT